jgi:Predicted nucleoside-diphosphate-sugar epimerases
MKYLITGATGHLGTHVFNQLIKIVPSTDVTAGVHTIAKAQHIVDAGAKTVAIDFLKEDTLVTAFKNKDVLIYIPSKSHDSFSRVSELENVIKAAQEAKVGHIVAMGFIADQETIRLICQHFMVIYQED